MRFGKPEQTEFATPAPQTVKVPVAEVVAEVGRVTWTWTFKGDNSIATARALFDKLTGDPDENGWLRDNSGEWAYKAEEVRAVRIRYSSETRPVAVPSKPPVDEWENGRGEIQRGVRCPSEHPTIAAARCQRPEGHTGSHVFTSGSDGRSVDW